VPDSASDWIRLLARAPRPAGGQAEAEARDHCAAHLRQHGFEVTEAPFAYSAWPGRYGTSLAGVAAIVTAAVAGHLGFHGYPGVALGVLVGMAALVGGLGWWLGRYGVLRLPLSRATGVNLVATRGRPAVWLVAHLDSKSQPVPILVRAGAIVVTGGWWLVAILVAALHGGAGWWIPLTLVGVVAALPVAASVVGARSDGAVDNASGVAAVLLAAAQVRAPLGVLLTSAEELGLAGARAWLVGAPAGVAINCDGVDDSGYLSLMYSHRRPARLVGAFGGGGLRVRRLLPGVLVDGVAFADAGWEAVTVSRGTVATLGRIHRPADRADRMTGIGVEAAAKAIVRAVSEL
jgi:Peptidase family M28